MARKKNVAQLTTEEEAEEDIRDEGFLLRNLGSQHRLLSLYPNSFFTASHSPSCEIASCDIFPFAVFNKFILFLLFTIYTQTYPLMLMLYYN